MIKADIHLDKYDWLVHCYLEADCKYAYDVMVELDSLGASRHYAEKAYENIAGCTLDNGICYSDTLMRESVLVTGLSSTPAEMLNSVVHEITHLATHIAGTYGIKCGGEEYCSLSGEIAEAMFPYVIAGLMEAGI